MQEMEPKVDTIFLEPRWYYAEHHEISESPVSLKEFM